MSWVNDDQMKNMLVSKATTNDLIVCLPQRVKLSDELAQQGAEVVTYGTSDPLHPPSRLLTFSVMDPALR